MTIMYDCLYIEADKKIDAIKDYLDSLEECERLKEEMFAHFHKTGEVPALLGFTIDDIANLVKENNTLKQYKKSKQASYEELQKKCNELELDNRKLKQILTEIKEIAEDQKDVLESMRIDIAQQILNKISEVIDEE